MFVSAYSRLSLDETPIINEKIGHGSLAASMSTSYMQAARKPSLASGTFFCGNFCALLLIQESKLSDTGVRMGT